MRVPDFHLTAEQHDALFYVLPSLHLTLHRCDNEQCRAVHGYGLSLSWLWFTINLDCMLA